MLIRAQLALIDERRQVLIECFEPLKHGGRRFGSGNQVALAAGTLKQRLHLTLLVDQRRR